MKLNIDLTGLHIPNEEVRGYFRSKSRAQLVLDAVKAFYPNTTLMLSRIRHRLNLLGHTEQSFWIITDEYGQPIAATDHLQRDKDDD